MPPDLYIFLGLIVLAVAWMVRGNRIQEIEAKQKKIERDLLNLHGRVSSHSHDITRVVDRQAVDHDRLEARVEKLELDADLDD